MAKVVVFLDALDPRKTTGLVKEIQKGSYKCVYPVVTPTNMGSILTGKNPGQHGLVCPTRFREGTRQRPVLQTIIEKVSERGVVLAHGIPFTANHRLQNGAVSAGDMDGGGEIALPALHFPTVGINMGDVDPEVALQHFMDQASMLFATFRDFIRNGVADYYFIGFRNLDSFTHWFATGGYYERLMEHLNAELAAMLCMGDDIDLFVFSDHGQMESNELFRLNLWLKEKGWLDYDLFLGNHKFQMDQQEKNTGKKPYRDQIGPFSQNFQVKEGSKFINADAFDSCIDVFPEATEEDIKELQEELIKTGFYKSVNTREEAWPGLTEEEYKRIPKIIPERKDGVLVSSNCMPGLPVVGFTDHLEIVNFRDGDHWPEGYYGCSLDLGIDEPVTGPESLYHMIDVFCTEPEKDEEENDSSLSSEDQAIMAEKLADLGYV
jgi:hypothetical protein